MDRRTKSDQTKPDQPSQPIGQLASQRASQRTSSIRSVCYDSPFVTIFSLPRGGNINCVSHPAVVLFSHALVIRAHMARHRSFLSVSLSFSLSYPPFSRKIALSLSPLVAAVQFVVLQRTPEIDGGSAEEVAFNGTFKSLCASVYIQRRPISTVVGRLNGESRRLPVCVPLSAGFRMRAIIDSKRSLSRTWAAFANVFL